VLQSKSKCVTFVAISVLLVLESKYVLDHTPLLNVIYSLLVESD
jgi:hypothetical protein